MSKYILHFIFLLLCLFQITCIYKGQRLTLQEQFEVEDLANEIFKKNRELIMGLFGLSSVSGGITCEACSFIVDVARNFLRQEKGFEKYYDIVRQVCRMTKVENKVCDGSYYLYRDIVVDSFFRRFLTGDYINNKYIFFIKK